MFQLRNVLALTAATAAVLLSSGCIVVVNDDEYPEYESHVRTTPSIGVELADVGRAAAAQASVDRDRVCVITRVNNGSPAERAGLKQWDIITHVDGRDWATISSVREAVRSKRRGETVALQVVREAKPIDFIVEVNAPD